MKDVGRTIGNTPSRINAVLHNTRFGSRSGCPVRIAIFILAVGFNALAILWAGSFLMAWVTAIPFVLLATVILYRKGRWRRVTTIIRNSWQNPFGFALCAITLVTTIIACLALYEYFNIQANTTLPEEGRPWREGLPARVWWQEPPTQEVEDSLAETAKLLGVVYERVHSREEANLRVWIDSWAYQCKWGGSYAVASVERNPNVCGGETGDIYVCRFNTPFADRPTADHSVISHEAGHIFAAQPHFGDGLMARGGGDYAERGTDEEVRTMRTRIKEFRESVESECEKTED